MSYVPCLVFTTMVLYLDMLATHAYVDMDTSVIQSTIFAFLVSYIFAFLVSALVLLLAAHWLSTLVTFVWTVPFFAAIVAFAAIQCLVATAARLPAASGRPSVSLRCCNRV